jgi:hypothetical protein
MLVTLRAFVTIAHIAWLSVFRQFAANQVENDGAAPPVFCGVSGLFWPLHHAEDPADCAINDYVFCGCHVDLR